MRFFWVLCIHVLILLVTLPFMPFSSWLEAESAITYLVMFLVVVFFYLIHGDADKTVQHLIVSGIAYLAVYALLKQFIPTATFDWYLLKNVGLGCIIIMGGHGMFIYWIGSKSGRQ